MEGILDALAKLSFQDLAAIGVVLFALLAIFVCVPCYLVFVTATGLGPKRAKSVCSHVLRSVKRPTRFDFHKIVPRLFLGSLPRTLEDLELLKAEGVGAVVTLNEAWEMALSTRFIRDECGMDHLHLPTPDFFSPMQPDIEAAVTFITDHVAKGIGVYVHCNGGRGRSVVCVLCYLVGSQGMSAEEAFDLVAEKRRVAAMRGSCGLHKQWRSVKRFERNLQRSRRTPFIAFKEEDDSIDNVASSPQGNAELSPNRDLVVSVAMEPESPIMAAKAPPAQRDDPLTVPGDSEGHPTKPCVGDSPPPPQNDPTGILEAGGHSLASAEQVPADAEEYDEDARYDSASESSEEAEPPLLE
ncbi:PTPMT1 [Symbiodinium natans]|uniref:PTPMT1 protein n=1 Tax=Symbiodinium natans TaxID=878477 RepID=A0A812QNV6_9DINO|nr:PTPMT1 [Symbiodinium natans]